ncbi:hypothetical protein [Spirosoma rhododendri]|uniref:Glycosyltransferase RgtA/B/C/D-like domain-containing protein n=1 Tax=Spirosoma rhododendri TaxID=2728024 RepID=A0A7L5DGU6_9BACT|nr:hypothetical protein [Spirosoma rhododendri]QJD77494.1 hypothetical protein HH216_02985 [Spirosoma rhododendri]
MIQPEKLTKWLSVGLFVILIGGLIPSLFYKEQWLWLDEVLSYLLVSDPSLTHMNDAIVSGMDANPPLFPNLYWLIGHGISLNPIFLRAVSVLLFASTIALFYRYVTSLIGTPVTNFVLITLIVSLTYLNVTLATQVRAYAVFLLIGFGYFIALQRLIGAPSRISWLLAQYGLGLLLVFTHNFGLFYVAVSGAFFVVLWLWSGQRTYLLVLATHGLIALSWLLLWYPEFAIQTQAGKPHSWIPLPTVTSFFRIAGELAPTLSAKLEMKPGMLTLTILRFVLVVGLFAYIAIPRLRKPFSTIKTDPAFGLYLLSGWIYIGVLAIAVGVSLVHTSVFLSRYLWPSHLLLVYQLLYAWYALGGRWTVWVFDSVWVRRAIPVYALLLVGFLFYQNKKGGIPFTDGIMRYMPQLDSRYPVLFESAHYFLPIWFQDKGVNAHYLLNWKTANDKDNILNATVEYKILEAVRNNYHINNILPEHSLAHYATSHFYVIDESNRYQVEDFIRKGSIRVVRQLPIDLPGHRILECVIAH